jgi:P27 family predicted phage terminase small subunit
VGLRGPRAKPTALKELAGNPGKRTLADGEPVPPAGAIELPKWLEGEEAESVRAREIWAELSPVLVSMRVLTIADRFAFGRYCQLHARWEALNVERSKRGWKGWSYALKGKDGQPRYAAPLPQAGEERAILEDLAKLEACFGLTPSSRTRIRVDASAPGAPETSMDQSKNEERRSFFASGGPKIRPTRAKNATA